MPSYCYSVWNGRERVLTVDRHYAMGKAPQRIVLADGRRAELDVAAQARTQGAEVEWSKPIHSHALGFSVDQREEALKAAERDGVPLELDSRGATVLRSRRQRFEVARWRNRGVGPAIHDLDGGYSDP